MSQSYLAIPSPPTGISGNAYTILLNTNLQALVTKHSGTTAPLVPQTYQDWIDTSVAPFAWKVYDGADWIVVGYIDATLNRFTPAFNPVNNQVGTTYGIVTADRDKFVTFSNAASTAVSLPQAGITFPAGWKVILRNKGAGTVTVTPVTSTINGAATLVLVQNAAASIISDGTNYFTIQDPISLAANVFVGKQTINLATGTDVHDSSTLDPGVNGPRYYSRHKTATPANGDFPYVWSFIAHNSALAEVVVAAHGVAHDVVTAGSTDGRHWWQTMQNGTLAYRMHLGEGLYMQGATGGDKGPGTVNLTEIYKNGALLDALPPGSVIDFAGATAPSGYLFCYGQAVSRTTFANLFTAIGTLYGIGDGTTTFNVPDFRGRVSAGLDNMGGTSAGRVTSVTMSPNGTTLGAASGEETHDLTVDEMPSHRHSGNAGSSAGTQLGSGNGSGSAYSTGLTGGGQPHNNMQPTLMINKIIKI